MAENNDNTSSGLLVDIHGVKAATYRGLLAKAHDGGLVAIETEMVMAPESDGAMVIFKATVTMQPVESGPMRTFSGYGDATHKSVKPNMRPSWVRMAETRAKSRALRDAVNVGVVSEDEILALRPDEDAARDLKKRKVALVRHVRQLQRRDGVEGLQPKAFLLAVLSDMGLEAIDEDEEIDAVEEAIDAGEYDLATGERVPATKPGKEGW